MTLQTCLNQLQRLFAQARFFFDDASDAMGDVRALGMWLFANLTQSQELP
jgi:hypothetical protein